MDIHPAYFHALMEQTGGSNYPIHKHKRRSKKSSKGHKRGHKDYGYHHISEVMNEPIFAHPELWHGWKPPRGYHFPRSVTEFKKQHPQQRHPALQHLDGLQTAHLSSIAKTLDHISGPKQQT